MDARSYFGSVVSAVQPDGIEHLEVDRVGGGGRTECVRNENSRLLETTVRPKPGDRSEVIRAITLGMELWACQNCGRAGTVGKLELWTC